MRILSPPDYEYSTEIPRIFVRNCYWTQEECQEIVDAVDENKLVDVYYYNNEMNDINWHEGVRNNSKLVVDCRDYKDQDPTVWVKNLVDKI